MRKIAIISVGVCIGIIILSASSVQIKEYPPIRKEKTRFQEGNDSLQDLLNCDKEDADAIAELFTEVTGQVIKEAELVPNKKKTRLLRISSGEKNYFLRITMRNQIQEIRSDTKNGKLLYQVIYSETK